MDTDHRRHHATWKLQLEPDDAEHVAELDSTSKCSMRDMQQKVADPISDTGSSTILAEDRRSRRGNIVSDRHRGS